VDNDLRVQFPGFARTDQFVALLNQVKAEELAPLLRERIHHLMALSEPQRSQFLTELDLAIAKLGPQAARKLMEAELNIVIELPNDRLEVALTARYRAHQAIEDEDKRLEADLALDQAIGDALGGPQRVLTRDFLGGIGWERP
jgi:hypothetical protein